MKIIFFGDSITDACRNRETDDLGNGYVKFAAGKIRLLYPDIEFEFLNRGIGGDRTTELLARVERDVVEEKPDLVVLQVGVNDVWHKYDTGRVTTPEQFRANYQKLVEIIRGTGAKLIPVQPYVLPVGVGAEIPQLRPELDEFNEIIYQICRDEQLPLVLMDEIFTGVTQDIAPKSFSEDGIHPTHRGCRYIADFIIKKIKRMI